MNVLRVFLTAIAAIFGGIALGGLMLAFKGHWVIGLPLAALGAPLGWVILKQARTYSIQSSAQQDAEFEETVRALGAKSNGIASIAAIVSATGYPRDVVEKRMRELIGRGMCEMDFADSGEMRFKLTPGDEARAQLAAMQEKK